jgi:outer membrane protein
MRLTAFLALLAAAAVSAPAAGQSPTGPTLTLDEAVALARQNNPSYLQIANNIRSADAGVRSAYASLLPSVNSSLSSSWNQGGRSFFGGAVLESNSNTVSSSYNLGVNYALNGAILLNPRVARANRHAVEADIVGAAEQLRASVTQQYVGVLQAEAKADVQDTLVATARAQLDLARAKTDAGAGTALDVRRAEVALGQSEVQALIARNAVEIERLRLYQQMGIPAPGHRVRLTTAFPVEVPRFSLDSLIAIAQGTHPGIEALRSRERAAAVGVRSRQSQYTPTLNLSTGWGGQAFEYTNSEFPVEQMRTQFESSRSSCLSQDSLRSRVGMSNLSCDRFLFTPDMAAQVRASNNNYPFNFTRAPLSFTATLRLPIFDNWQREQSVQEARVVREDAQYAVRQRALQIDSDVTQAYLNLVTAARTVELQEQNAVKAREELQYAEERYRVGASTFIEVTTSRATYEQAQLDRVNSVYDYHKAFATLESAVGRPLR